MIIVICVTDILAKTYRYPEYSYRTPTCTVKRSPNKIVVNYVHTGCACKYILQDLCKQQGYRTTMFSQATQNVGGGPRYL